ncbi:E3 ubiquitin-protein ligase ATL6 [Carex littledalei]|uniref:RING-type E3 ubiquitin transferase n=1 Tax=Carex littledalei TaxID=544730 RepID=A0A833QHD3_9POAL|nr:E3 ubiquitin-protein ligase ATL6 [Carex littledalei]
MKSHLYVAVMNGSQPYIPLLRFSSTDDRETQTTNTIATSASNSTDNRNGSLQGFSKANIMIIILFVVIFLILIFVIYIVALYAKRQRMLPATATAPTAPDLNISRTRSRGVHQSVIDTFPAIGYATVKILRSSKSPLECAICISEFVDDDILRLLPGCRHVFHTDCIDTWLENHVTCPVCRSNLSDPEVLAGKRLLSMNSELEDFDISSQVSEHEQKSDNSLRRKEIRRAQSITEGWERFTLTLPEQVLREIEATKKHRRSTSVQDYTFQGKASWRDRKLSAFFKSFSQNKRNREGDDMSTVAEGVEASVSTATSSRHIIETSIHGETSETEPTLVEVDLTDLPVHERV